MSLIITGAQVPIQKNKDQQLSATVLKGITTCFTASWLNDNGSPGTVTWSLTGTSNAKTELSVIAGQAQVTPSTVGTMQLEATSANPQGSCTVQLTVEESDLLISAPDGYVYRVPRAVWANAQSNSAGGSPSSTAVRRYLPSELSQTVQDLLTHGVEAANIPNPAIQNHTSLTAGEPSDNITCFLLNLNSLLLNPGK